MCFTALLLLLLLLLKQGKAVPLQAWKGPEGSRRLRLQDFKKLVGLSALAPATFTPRKYSWYSSLLEV